MKGGKLWITQKKPYFKPHSKLTNPTNLWITWG